MRVILNMSLMSSPPCKECPLKPLRAEVFTSTTEKMVLPGLTMHPNYTYDGCFPHVCLELFLPSKPYKFTGKERDSESGRVARRINPKTTLGALPSVFEGGVFDFAIFPSSLMCRSHSARLIAVRPSFSTIRCKTLNIFIKVCYSPPCLPNTILACLLFPLLEDSSTAGNGSALSDSLPPLFSSLPTTNCSLSTLPPSPMESYRLPTPTP